MDAVFINPAYFPKDVASQRYDRFAGFIRKGNMYFLPFEPPLGLASLVSYLRGKGLEVRLVDQPGEGLSTAEVAESALHDKPRLVGITSMTPTIKVGLELARAVKARSPATPVVLGGVHPTVSPESLLEQSEVDLVVRGEGEMPLAWLLEGGLEALAQGRTAPQGICYKRDANRFLSGRAPLISNIEDLPPPDYHAFPVEEYVRYTQELRGMRAISMMVTRGCPYQCAFCAVQETMGRCWRRRKARHASALMDRLVADLRLEGIWFKDSIFNLNTGWTKSFCVARARSPVNAFWQINTRCDLVRQDEIHQMADAGLVQIDLGIESGSERTLNTLNKKITVRDIRRAIEIARERVKVSGFFMIGVPGETEDDIRSSFELARDLALDAYCWSIYTPLPGSSIFECLRQQGRIGPSQDFEKIHFTEADRSYCEVPIERLKELYYEINEHFSLPAA